MRAKRNSLVVLFVNCFVLVACQSLSITLPGPGIESPAAPGVSGDFDLEAGYRGATGVQVADNAGKRPFVVEEPKVFKTGELFTKGLIGIGSQVEVAVAIALPGSFSVYGKYQFLGHPRTERTEDEYLGAIYAIIGGGSTSQSGDQATEFGAGGFPWKANASGTVFGLGASFGFQAAQWLLVYGGLSHYNYSLTYKIDQDATGSYPAVNHAGTQDGSADTVGFGLEYGKKVMIGVTGQYTWRYWVSNRPVNGADASIFAKFLFK